MTDDVEYPSVELVLDLHEQVVAEGETTESGVRSADSIESALQYVSEGFFGEVPATVHEKAVHLVRLLVADHPFVDGNKRTALRTVVVLCMLNGHTFEYGDEMRALLHRFATEEAEVDVEMAVIYFRACARHNEEIDPSATSRSAMVSNTNSSTAVDDEVRQLYERYLSAESDEERHEIALEIGKLDGRRHAAIYAALEDE
ncbi:death-on-curing family protein [Halomicrobium zhouii]|uniref:Death-on-curing family protein n=1 Tax=Halomicrobium zhouii TaxID=767519 RepID=A0A1I6KFS1_9EURY|nr:type II toxin-antitoxin system death-on-curing family toxin [Halomicrobium zhouii]SFR90079.1 death-on-curing family protein [Halomicrobium zhouii]